MTREQYDQLSAPLVRTLLDMEDDILREIAAQLAKDGKVSDTSKWRIRQLAGSGRFDKRAAAIIDGYSGVQNGQALDMILEAAQTEIGYLDNAVQAANATGLSEYFSDIPAETSALNAAKAFQRQAASDLNLVNTVMKYKAGSAFVSAVNSVYRESQKSRQDVLDAMGKSSAKVVMGHMSLQEATRKTIRELARKGIPAFVDKAGREWSPEAYIMMDMRSTLANTARAAQDMRCDQYGIQLIEVSSHMGARPLCAPYQGRIFSRDGSKGITTDGAGGKIYYTPLSETSFGEPAGLFGINCGHVQYPFVPGINFQRYFPYPKEENDRRYQQFQRQRAMERDIRATKRECMMLQELDDTEGLQKASQRLRSQKQKYSQYSKDCGLGTHYDRTQVYGYDRSKSSKTVWAERKANGKVTNYAASNFGPNRVEFNPNASFKAYVEKYSETVNESVSKACREVVDLGRKSNHEHLILVNTKTGKWDYQEEGTPGNVGGKEFWDYINANKSEKFIFVHNHSDGQTFSMQDLCTFTTAPNIDSFVASCDNGKIYYVFDMKKKLEHQNPIMEVIMKENDLMEMEVSPGISLKDLKNARDSGKIGIGDYNDAHLLMQSEFIIKNYCEFKEFYT